MKKIISLLLVLFMLSFVVACGDDPINTESTPLNTSTTDTETDTNSDTNTDTSTDTDTDTDTEDSGSNGENQNDILGSGWTPPQN